MLLQIPFELRHQIYSYLIPTNCTLDLIFHNHAHFRPLRLTCHQIGHEVEFFLYSEKYFAMLLIVGKSTPLRQEGRGTYTGNVIPLHPLSKFGARAL